MSMGSDDITIEISRGIRDEIRTLREDTKSTLLDVVTQQRSLVRYTRKIAEHDTQLESN
jgi:hypothetical protein